MSTPVKYAAITVGIGVLFLLARSVNKWANKITVTFQSIGIPIIRNANLALPVTVLVNNVTPVAIPINNLQAALYILRNGVYTLLGTTESTGPFTLNTGNNPVTLYPTINLALLVPQNVNVLNVLNTLANYQPAATIRIVAKVNVQGVEFEKTTDHKIYYSQLYAA